MRNQSLISGGVSIIVGIAVLILNGLATNLWFLGLIAAAAIIFLGYRMIAGNSGAKAEVAQGAILMGVGVLVALAALGIPLLGGLSSVILVIAGIGLIGYGVWKFILFFRSN